MLAGTLDGDDVKLGSPQALRNLKYRGSERCTSLIWDHYGRDIVTTKKIVALLPKKLPSLQHLSLTL